MMATPYYISIELLHSITGKKLIVRHSTKEGQITNWKLQFSFFSTSLGTIEKKEKKHPKKKNHGFSI